MAESLPTQIPLGKLEVGEQIGEGGFGTVHKARLIGIDFDFAVKFLKPSPFNTDKEALRKRFFREAEVLFKLRHRYISAIHGVGEYNDRPYILMELYDGFDLYEARDRQPKPDADKVLRFISRIAEALAFAHFKGILHRDIKPSNLMARYGDARILDFGLAGLLDPEGTRFTKTGNRPAGDVFAAPEFVESPDILDERCDIFSLGACWFWLLTGTAPKGVNWESTLRGSTDISPEYERVVLKCLEQRDKRYTTAAHLLDDLEALEEDKSPEIASRNALSDHEALILVTIIGAFPGSKEPLSSYRLEQEVQPSMDSFTLTVSLRKLKRLDYIEELSETDINGETSHAYLPTEKGLTWGENHQEQARELLSKHRETVEANQVYDDVPF